LIFNENTGKEMMKVPLKFVLCFQFILLSIFYVSGQEIEEYLIKSVLLCRAPEFIEWPPNASYLGTQDNFVISIIGTDPFSGKLETIIKSRNIKIKNKNVSVKIINKIEEIGNSDMLFISNSEKNNLTKILNYVNNKPILTISDTKVFIDKGVMINMYIESSKLLFNINLKSSNASKIYISSKFLVNANKVIK
jgi:hypothetical protein